MISPLGTVRPEIAVDRRTSPSEPSHERVRAAVALQNQRAGLEIGSRSDDEEFEQPGPLLRRY